MLMLPLLLQAQHDWQRPDCSVSAQRWVPVPHLGFIVACRFALPLGHDEATLNSMLSLAIAYIDLLGTYRLSPEQKKRADKV